MARGIYLLFAALVSVSVAAARSDAARHRIAESQTDTLHSVLAGVPTRIAGRGPAAGKKPLVVLRSGGREYVAPSLNAISHKDIKSVSVLKGASCRMFETYGDTSDGVIVVDLRENARIPDGARIARAPSDSAAVRSGDTAGKGAGKPLTLVIDGCGEVHAVGSLGSIRAEDVESITIIKNDDARKYDSYGDTSKGVVVVRIKKDSIPKE